VLHWDSQPMKTGMHVWAAMVRLTEEAHEEVCNAAYLPTRGYLCSRWRVSRDAQRSPCISRHCQRAPRPVQLGVVYPGSASGFVQSSPPVPGEPREGCPRGLPRLLGGGSQMAVARHTPRDGHFDLRHQRLPTDSRIRPWQSGAPATVSRDRVRHGRSPRQCPAYRGRSSYRCR
jgi:hypothetical protein